MGRRGFLGRVREVEATFWEENKREMQIRFLVPSAFSGNERGSRRGAAG